MAKPKKKKHMVMMLPESGKDLGKTGKLDGKISPNILIYVRKKKPGTPEFTARKYNPVTRQHEKFYEKKISKN